MLAGIFAISVKQSASGNQRVEISKYQLARVNWFVSISESQPVSAISELPLASGNQRAPHQRVAISEWQLVRAN